MQDEVRFERIQNCSISQIEIGVDRLTFALCRPADLTPEQISAINGHCQCSRRNESDSDRNMPTDFPRQLLHDAHVWLALPRRWIVIQYLSQNPRGSYTSATPLIQFPSEPRYSDSLAPDQGRHGSRNWQFKCTGPGKGREAVFTAWSTVS